MSFRTRSFVRVMSCALIMLMAVASGAPAAADVLTVVAKGTIAPTCSLSSTGNFPAANFNSAGSAAATANINCNQLFKVTATSANGAIKSGALASGRLSNSLPYTLRADVALDNGSVSDSCGSADLMAGKSTCKLSPANGTGLISNGQIATNKTATLTASWSPPALPTMLVPGSYSDTITLTIATVP